nr:hypothetical protein [Pelistega indica]
MAHTSITPLHQLDSWHQFTQAVKSAPLNKEALRLVKSAGLTIDLSAQRYSSKLQRAVAQLLDDRQFCQQRHALFHGEICNTTENRPAWHTMLREPQPIAEVAEERKRVLEFVRRTDSDRRWRNIVHIGIGGSDWGGFDSPLVPLVMLVLGVIFVLSPILTDMPLKQVLQG